MNQGGHNRFSECGWFVCFSADSGTQVILDNPVILSKNLYTYDRLGRQKVAQTFLSAHHYAYDPATLAMVSETIIDLQAGTSNVITRATDALGRSTGFSVAGVGDPGSPYAVEYGYDAYGRFHSVTSSVRSMSPRSGKSAKSVAIYSYLPNSDLVAGMTASSGFLWTRAYESSRSLITSVENRFGETVI